MQFNGVESVFYRICVMSMMTAFTSPVFPGDEVKSLRAKLIHTALLANIALMVVCFIAGVVGGRHPPLVVQVEAVMALLSLAGVFAVKRGHLALASGALLGIGFVLLTVLILRLGTIRVPATGFYVALVIAAGLLFDLRAMVLMVVLSSAAVGGIVFAENAGWLPRPDYAVNITQWIATSALLASVGGWTYGALHFIQRGLCRAEAEIAERKRAEAALQNKITELSHALSEVKVLSGLLPICSGCKRIRDDHNYWHKVETYIAQHTDATFTHGYCPVCVKQYFPGIADQQSDK